MRLRRQLLESLLKQLAEVGGRSWDGDRWPPGATRSSSGALRFGFGDRVANTPRKLKGVSHPRLKQLEPGCVQW